MALLRLIIGGLLVVHVVIGVVNDSLLIVRGTQPDSEFAWIAFGEAPFGFVVFSGLYLLIGIALVRRALQNGN